MRITRRSQAKKAVNINQNKNEDASSTSNPVQSRKRTLSSIQNQVPTANPTPASASNARASKMPRNDGPPRGRPLQLDLGENNQEEWQGREAIDKAFSFYPGRRANDESTTFLPNSFHLTDTDSNDGDTEIECADDWLEEPELEEVATKISSKAAEAMAIERPTWHDPAPVSDPVVNDEPVNQTATPLQAQSVWPVETDLLYVSGTRKVILTVQRPIMRTIIQDAFEQVRRELLFTNAFPDAFTALEFTQYGLLTAAQGHDRATDIHNRLVSDAEYMSRMVPLPRARIPLFRAEVKDRCVAIVRAEFLSVGSETVVAELAQKQLGHYNYTFPTGASSNPLVFIPKRTQPYRNVRIINVIRDLYFAGGTTSFAYRFKTEFSTYETNTGTVKCEVPIAMVALVATALYAAIKEWRNGKHQPLEFSANAFLDVYDGNVNTLEHIRDNREDAFHLMMCDIYSKASTATVGGGGSGAAIADIPLDDIEG